MDKTGGVGDTKPKNNGNAFTGIKIQERNFSKSCKLALAKKIFAKEI